MILMMCYEILTSFLASDIAMSLYKVHIYAEILSLAFKIMKHFFG